MRTLALMFVFSFCGNLFGQSLLDALRQPSNNADMELLNQANQAAQSTSNALAKRASLLQRRADTLRSQVDQLEKEVEVLRAERAAIKAAVIECRDQFVVILEMLEKKDFAPIEKAVEKLRTTYSRSMLPKLVSNEPSEKQPSDNVLHAPSSTSQPADDANKKIATETAPAKSVADD